MKRITALAAMLVCVAITTWASQPVVGVEANLRPDNSLVFSAEITGYGNITVELRFSDVENCTEASNPGERKVVFLNNGRHDFLTLYPEDPARPVEAEFTYTWLQGKLDPKVDAGFIYRLPFEAGLTTVPRALGSSDLGLFRGNFIDFKVWQFPLRKGDAVYPLRAGKVIRTEGFFEPASDEQAMMASGGNRIFIEHPDGTISEYSSLEWNSLEVREGDSVYPDTPLARTGYIDRHDRGVNVGLYYHVTNRSMRQPNAISAQKYIDPLFMTAAGNTRLSDGQSVTAATTKALINKEREQKSFWRRLFRKE